MSTATHKAFNSFAQFYPYYLQEHSNATCRRLHYVGSSLRGDWVMLKDALTSRIRF